MRRSLVLTSEAARHPFRASLPPHVFRMAEQASRGWRFGLADLRHFLAAYVAGCIAVLAFIV